MAKKKNNKQQDEGKPAVASFPYAKPYAREGEVSKDRHGLHVSVGGVVYYLTNAEIAMQRPIHRLLTLYRPDVDAAYLSSISNAGAHSTDGRNCSCAITMMTGQRCSDIKNYQEAKQLLEAYIERERLLNEPEPV